MDLGIAGKRALVLGGSKGLGRGIAEALASEGVTVALTGRDAASAAKVASDIGPSARGYALDLSKSEMLDGLLDQLEADFGAIDILVLNGGGPPPSAASTLGKNSRASATDTAGRRRLGPPVSPGGALRPERSRETPGTLVAHAIDSDQ